jgi:hypothetical protein
MKLVLNAFKDVLSSGTDLLPVLKNMIFRRQTRRTRGASGSEEKTAAADSGSPGEDSRKKTPGRAANMSPIATK